ncbi:MAG: barstar family protein [Anaerolineae bacterium]|nr:barstar family protein [Anaerolineae bacterium]
MLHDVNAIFRKETAPGVYVSDTVSSLEYLLDLASHSGFRLFYLDGKTIFNFLTFHHRLKEALSSAYMGENWNAVYDCLKDLAHLPPPKEGYILYFENFQYFAQGDKQNFSLAIEVLRDAIEFWKQFDVPMYVLLKGDISLLPDTMNLK